MLKDELKKKQEELEKLINNLEREIEIAPNGNLRISVEKNKPLYFRVTERNDTHGTYLKQSEEDLVRQLAQKSYNTKLLKMAEEQYRKINRFYETYNEDSLINVYDSLNDLRKPLINPIVLSDEQFLEEWMKIEYVGKTMDITDNSRTTKKGEIVRSKSELIIANALYDAGIPYRYEYPLRLSKVTVYPDFTILKVRARKVAYWEHFGIMDSEEYRKEFYFKQNLYSKNGIIPGGNLYMTFEEKNMQLSTQTVSAIIRHIMDEE